MKNILVILLIFTVNVSYAQNDKTNSVKGTDTTSGEVNFFAKLFGKSNKSLDLEKTEKNVHEKDIYKLKVKINSFEGELQGYKIKQIQDNNDIEKSLKILGKENEDIKDSIDVKNKKLQIELFNHLNKITTTTEKRENLLEAKLADTVSKTHELELLINELYKQLSIATSYSETLNEKINKNNNNTSNDFASYDNKLGKTTRYWIVSLILVVIGIIVLFIITRKLISKSKNITIETIKETRKNLEEESIKLDNKLIDLIENQISVNSMSNDHDVAEQDHSLALKVADEIVRINKNISRMDKSIKGLKQLTASVTRIQDNFSSNGYEIVEMLGLPYNEGMKVSANIIPDDDLDEGEQIITRIIKPQVNYHDVMIQSAQIEVSIGE